MSKQRGLFSDSSHNKLEMLFYSLYSAKDEQQLDEVLTNHSDIFNNPNNWLPLGGNDSNLGVVENQQANPVAALVEKLTNSIDAILMRKCYEAGIDPKSLQAPQSIQDAIEQFFPEHKRWDIPKHRQTQAKNIQIVADGWKGPSHDTSLVIYDNGEGQHPEDFEKTFLSLLRGNKNEIHFVQGKYNMGGSGAIVFCGKKRYQLIASRRYDGKGNIGFTLVRRHPFTESESIKKKNTWYEYLKIDGKIPSFIFNKPLDLKLYDQKFETGTVIKLYSYEVKGNRHIARDLNRSINEFLYEPALPIYTIETLERYPEDRECERDLYGLKRRLDSMKDKYLECSRSLDVTLEKIGRVKVMIYVFKARIEGKDVKETIEAIQREFFKNDMAVLFSINGQVHGSYTSEFITRSLKFPILKNHLLIHVDCTYMDYAFRTELFMASRDRLKGGEEAKKLRDELARRLRNDLIDIYKRRKDIISVDSSDSDELLKSFVDKLPLNQDLQQLLDQMFRLEKPGGKIPEPKPTNNNDNKKIESRPRQKEERPFQPKRFPSFFAVDIKETGGRKVVAVPLGGEKTISFLSDVENEYFDRVEEPGEMELGLLEYERNETKGGKKRGKPKAVKDVLSVERRSPNDGKIKVVIQPTDNVQIGDEIELRADLSSPGQDFSTAFWVKITEPLPPVNPKKEEPQPEKLGLPQLIPVYEKPSEDDPNRTTWDKVANVITMDYSIVMYPLIDSDLLQSIYINMDSSILKNYKAKQKNPSAEQLHLITNRYISSVYAHTLFMYVISKQKGYNFLNKDGREMELGEYLQELFENHYTDFLLSFGTGDLLNML